MTNGYVQQKSNSMANDILGGSLSHTVTSSFPLCLVGFFHLIVQFFSCLLVFFFSALKSLATYCGCQFSVFMLPGYSMGCLISFSLFSTISMCYFVLLYYYVYFRVFCFSLIYQKPIRSLMRNRRVVDPEEGETGRIWEFQREKRKEKLYIICEGKSVFKKMKKYVARVKKKKYFTD